MNIEWDADKYTADFSFVHKYGNSMIDMINADEGGKWYADYVRIRMKAVRL